MNYTLQYFYLNIVVAYSMILVLSINSTVHNYGASIKT